MTCLSAVVYLSLNGMLYNVCRLTYNDRRLFQPQKLSLRCTMSITLQRVGSELNDRPGNAVIRRQIHRDGPLCWCSSFDLTRSDMCDVRNTNRRVRTDVTLLRTHVTPLRKRQIRCAAGVWRAIKGTSRQHFVSRRLCGIRPDGVIRARVKDNPCFVLTVSRTHSRNRLHFSTAATQSLYAVCFEK